ncbi:MAG: hypothetical protein QXK88_01935 [Desulfurococcaceae archaeon]
MSATIASPGVLSRFLSLFKNRDPAKKELVQSVTMLDKLLRSLEISRKNLEAVAEEHRKKMRSQGDDKELTKILDEEVKNIYGYLSMLTKTVYDLTKVKYRLETLFYVEEPLKVIPEVLEELKAIEPSIEKINPQLINQVRALEQRVASIMSMSSPYIPGLTSTTLISSYSTEQRSPYSNRKVQAPPQVKPSPTTQPKGEKAPSSSLQQEKKKEEPLQAPVAQAPDKKQETAALQQPQVQVNFSVPLHIVEQWLLNELRVTAGILDISVFEKKYGVPRNVVLEALSSLESKKLVQVKRR